MALSFETDFVKTASYSFKSAIRNLQSEI